MFLLVATAPPIRSDAVAQLVGRQDTDRPAGPRRDRSASAYGLLRLVLEELTGRPAREHNWLRRCGACGGPHGKPVLDPPSLHVSVSSTAGLVAVAVTDAGPVGVDVEQRHHTAFEGFPPVVLAPGEPDGDRGQTWSRKEAWLKATGTGLAVDPRDLNAALPPQGVQLYDVLVADEIACAAAVLSAERPELTTQRRCLS